MGQLESDRTNAPVSVVRDSGPMNEAEVAALGTTAR